VSGGGLFAAPLNAADVLNFSGGPRVQSSTNPTYNCSARSFSHLNLSKIYWATGRHRSF
jgi:hypothetical protein